LDIGNSIRLDKRHALLLFVFTIWAWIGFNIYSHATVNTIKATIVQSMKPIRSLDDNIFQGKKEALYIESLNFPKGNKFYHPHHGFLHYKKNFKIFFDTYMETTKDQYIDFVIYSDDGFRLVVDKKTVLEFTKDRPFKKSEKIIRLKSGKHHLHIKYFQGYGQLGIAGYYSVGKSIQSAKNSKKILIGKSCDDLRFLPLGNSN